MCQEKKNNDHTRILEIWYELRNPLHSLPKGTLWVKYELYRAVGRENILWGLMDKQSHTATMNANAGSFFFLKQARYPSFDSLHVSIGQLCRSIHVFTWYDIKIVLPSTGLWTFLLNLLNTYNLHFFLNIILWNWLHFFKHNFVKLDNCYIWYTVNQYVCICGSAKIFPHKTS